ncbi:MAG: HAD family hydrolase [Candidatus Thermoplasmatota archaeon]|nr:HAD family hydrolase [Candidatus Thermoplasmatota archaeon]
MSRTKAIFFDLDDTLFDYTNSRHRAFEALIMKFTELSGASIEDMDSRWTKYWYELLPSGVIRDSSVIMHMRRERLRLIFRDYGTNLSEQEMECVMRTYSENYDNSISQVPGAGSLLKEIKASGISVGVITNNPPEGQKKKLKKCGVEDYVDILVCSGEVGYSKPDPRIFGLSMDRIGTNPEESVMIGDSWEYDVVGAMNSGLRAVWFNRFDLKRPEISANVIEIKSYIPPETILQKLGI